MVHEPFTADFCRYPVLSEVALTYRCNLSCGFCYAGCGVGALPDGWSEERVMSDDEVCRVLDVIRHDARCPERQLHRRRAHAAPGARPGSSRHAKGLGLKVNLISNGQRLDAARVAALAEAGLDSAQLSLEGPTAAIHDALVDRPGAFDRLWGAVERLQERGVRVHTNTTVNRQNLAHAAAIVDLVADRGLERLTMNLVIPCGSAGERPALGVSYSEIGDHVLRLRDRAEARGVELIWYSPLPLCLLNTIAHGLGNRGCAAADGLLHVEPRRGRPALLQLRPRREPRQPAARPLRAGLAVARRPLLPGQADDAARVPRLPRGRRLPGGLRPLLARGRARPSWAARPRPDRPFPRASPVNARLSRGPMPRLSSRRGDEMRRSAAA